MFAATWAARSAILCSTFRHGYLPDDKIFLISFSRNIPLSNNLKLSIKTPSSSICFESGGPEPGVLPPMSAWWPREATKNIISFPFLSKTGVITVTSGRCVPPLNGALSTKTSSG